MFSFFCLCSLKSLSFKIQIKIHLFHTDLTDQLQVKVIPSSKVLQHLVYITYRYNIHSSDVFECLLYARKSSCGVYHSQTFSVTICDHDLSIILLDCYILDIRDHVWRPCILHCPLQRAFAHSWWSVSICRISIELRISYQRVRR